MENTEPKKPPNLLICKTSEQKAKAALKAISAAFIFIMYLTGFLILLKSRYNFTVLAVAIYLTVRFVKE